MTNSSPRTTQKTIAIGRIHPDPGQPRTIFDATALAELASSMRELGQLQPISVLYQPGSRDYRIIMGERRWRAARIAGLAELHCLVLHGLDNEDTFLRAVAENVGRADMSPLEEARAFARLMQAGYDPTQIGAKCGRDGVYVRGRVELLDLVPAAQEALRQANLPVGLAWYVSRLTPDSQHVFLRKYGRGDFPSHRDAEAFARASRNNAAELGLFDMAELSVEERAMIIAKRKAVAAKVDRLDGAGAILSDLAHTDPAELATLLAGAPGGVGAYQLRVQHLQTAASKAAAVLRAAAAMAAVRAPGLDLIDA